MIDPESLEFKGPTRGNNQYCVVGQTLDCWDGNDLDLLISRGINDDLVVFIKRFEQEPDLGEKMVH